jgi:hypothetical protein
MDAAPGLAPRTATARIRTSSRAVVKDRLDVVAV